MNDKDFSGRYTAFAVVAVLAIVSYFLLRNTGDDPDAEISRVAPGRSTAMLQRALGFDLADFNGKFTGERSFEDSLDLNAIHLYSYSWVFSRALAGVEYSSLEAASIERAASAVLRRGYSPVLHLRLLWLAETKPRRVEDRFLRGLEMWIDKRAELAARVGIETLCLDLGEISDILAPRDRGLLLERLRTRFSGLLSSDAGHCFSPEAEAAYARCDYLTWSCPFEGRFDRSAFLAALDSLATAALALHRRVLVSVAPRRDAMKDAVPLFGFPASGVHADKTAPGLDTACAALLRQPWLCGFVLPAEFVDNPPGRRLSIAQTFLIDFYRRLPRGGPGETTIDASREYDR